ncbi:hypothetical protein B0A55_02110 [Friedmanniomyces simplex]|uniref:Uncharacterized protein n=1 Tax=Friedmanniomyces simplex TaxID=329884 RepID=A0A4U0XTK1_9PEZI|nr:hypothetical protein B0A55_02110 [Friedmanniomyces simplex]
MDLSRTAITMLASGITVFSLVVVHAGLFACGFEIYGRLSRRLLPPTPEKAEAGRNLAKDPYADFINNLSVTDEWKLLRAALLLAQTMGCLDPSTVMWSNSHLGSLVEVTCLVFGLVVVKEVWKWVLGMVGSTELDAAGCAVVLVRYFHAARAAIQAFQRELYTTQRSQPLFTHQFGVPDPDPAARD